MSVTAELLGLPPNRSWVDPPLGGAYLPGATVELRAGLDHGVAAPRRSLIFELRRTGEVVARTRLEVTVISPSRPMELALRLPETPGTTYELVLDVAGECVSWEIVVPEQRVDACFEFERQVVRRGELLRASIRNGAIALDTGVAYGFERWNGVDWVHVDPFDGEPGAWAAIGLGIPAGASWPERVRVPERTEPGRHRVTKWVSAEHRGIGDVRLHGEFVVRDGPSVDYEALLRTGTWMGVAPGADRESVGSALGEPDGRDEDDRVWRYGDLHLRFYGDRLREFFGESLPDSLVNELVADDRKGVWTVELAPGARVAFERPHDHSFARLRGFTIAR